MQQGFTIIELIILVAVLLVLGTMSTSFSARFLTQNNVENATDQLINDFRKAQTNSMMGKHDSKWGVNYSANTITLYHGSSYVTRDPAFDEKFSVSSSITISGFSDINFSRKTGTASAAPTITISGAGNSNTITINSQGVATR